MSKNQIKARPHLSKLPRATPCSPTTFSEGPKSLKRRLIFQSFSAAAASLQLCPALCHPPGSLPMDFCRQEHWSRLPCPPPGDLPNPGIKPGLLHCRRILYSWATREAQSFLYPTPNRQLPVSGMVFFYDLLPLCDAHRLPCPWMFPGQDDWSGLPFPSPGKLPDPGIVWSHGARTDLFISTFHFFKSRPLSSYRVAVFNRFLVVHFLIY